MNVACALARQGMRSNCACLEFSLLLSLFQDKESKSTELKGKACEDTSFGNQKGFQNVEETSLLKNKNSQPLQLTIFKHFKNPFTNAQESFAAQPSTALLKA
jgi:hypothetical protein